MTRWLLWPMLFRASYAMPPVMLPSPMTATMWRCGSVPASRAMAKPYAYESTVLAWLFSM